LQIEIFTMSDVRLNLPAALFTELSNVAAKLQHDSRGTFVSQLDSQSKKKCPFHILLVNQLRQCTTDNEMQAVLAQLQQLINISPVQFQLTRWTVVAGSLCVEVASAALPSLAAAVCTALKQGSVAASPFFITLGDINDSDSVSNLLKFFPIPQQTVFQAHEFAFENHTQLTSAPIRLIGDGEGDLSEGAPSLDELKSAPPQKQWSLMVSMLIPLVLAELAQRNIAPTFAESVAVMIMRYGFSIEDLYAMAAGSDPRRLQMTITQFLEAMHRPQQAANNMLGVLFTVGSLQIRGGICEPRQLRMELWGGGQRATWTDVIDHLWSSPTGRVQWNAILKNVPFQAFMLETSPLCAATANRPFEMVAIDTPEDDFKPLHRNTFKRVHQGMHTSVAFQAKNPKTGTEGSTRFIAPGDVGGRRRALGALDAEKRRHVTCCAHLAKFVREGAAEQQEDFWALVQKELKGHLSDAACTWVSTEGRGVHWLHLRLAKGPLHFSHQPYKVRPLSAFARSSSAPRARCRFFAEGRCLKGTLCRFAHVSVAGAAGAAATVEGYPSRGNKTIGGATLETIPAMPHPATLAGAEPCWFYQQGSCRFGHNCRKAHVMTPSAARK